MRNLFVLLLTGAVSLGLSTPRSHAQPQPPIKTADPEKVLADALKNIKEKDKIDLRIQAAMDLADFGVKAEPALADLLDALQTKNEDLRLNAAIALAKIGKKSVAPVAELLKSDDLDLKFYAIWTLGWIGPDAKETVPTMIKLMSDKNEALRRKAAFALGRLAGDPEKTISVLIAAFKDEHEDVRNAAGDALWKFGKDAVPPLIEVLKGDSPTARLRAATSLGEIGTDAKDAVPLLKDLYLSEKSDGAQHYAMMLAKLGKTAVPALEAGFKDKRPEIRQFAAAAITQLGAEAVGILVDGLGDKDVETRRLAAQTLWPMRIGDKSVVIALAFGLSDTDDLVRQHCMNALATIGIPAKLGSAKIKDALTDMNPEVRRQAYYLLQSFNENPQPALMKGLENKNAKIRLMVQVNFAVNDAMPILLDALKDDDLGLRMQAASTLAQTNRETGKVAAIFVDGLKHKSVSVRIQAAQGLGQLGNTGKTPPEAIQALAGALKDSEATVRQQALYALQSQRGDLSAIVPMLVELVKDKDLNIRQQIIWMFQRAGDAGVEPLGDFLKDSDPQVRSQAMQALRNLGPRAKKVLPAIKDAVKDENANVRLNAMITLATVGGEGPEFLVKHFGVEKDANTRANLISHLAYSGQQKHVLPLLTTAIKDASPQVRQTTVNVIGVFGRDSKEGFEVFTIGLKDSDTNVRTQAAYNAGHYGNKAWDPLSEAMKSAKDANFRIAILQGMMGTQFRAKTGVTPLVDCLKDDNVTIRQWACIVLGNMGPDAADALPRLREIAKSDGNQAVQNQARASIMQIEKKK